MRSLSLGFVLLSFSWSFPAAFPVSNELWKLPVFLERLQASNTALHEARELASAAEAGVSASVEMKNLELGMDFMPADKMIVAAQELPFPAKGIVAKQAARLGAEAARARCDALRLELGAAAEGKWAKAWRLEKSAGLYEESIALLSSLSALLKTQYGSGKGLPSDILRAEAERERMAIQWRRNQAEHRAALSELFSMIRVPVPVEARLEEISIPTNAIAWEALVEALDGKAPGRRVREALAGQARARVSMAAWEFAPDLMLDGRWSTTMGIGGSTFMAKLTLPLPAVKKASALAQAKAEARAEEAGRDAWRLEARARLDGLWARFTTERDIALSAERTLVPIAREVALLSENEYRGGKGEFIAVLEARRRILEARLEADEAKSEAFALWAEIKALTGIGGRGDEATSMNKRNHQ